jgi:heme-degrading monooxygenase HmoA
MNAVRARRMVTLMLGFLMVWLGGCAIGTPWPRLVTSSVEEGNQTVVLVLTRVVVDTQQRSEFDRQTSRVLASMGSQPGLIGYAARRQLFGDQGWTLSVWVNDEARAAFVRSAVHREAIAKSLPALRVVELKRLTVARKDLPANWDEVLRQLANPEGRRSYLEPR